MSFDNFLAKHPITGCSSEEMVKQSFGIPTELEKILVIYGGKTFGGGILRLYNLQGVAGITDRLLGQFPSLRDRIFVFGCDWHGRQLCVCSSSPKDSVSGVLMLEPSAGNFFIIPVQIRDFFDREITAHTQDILAESYWHQWRNSPAGRDLLPNECVGDRVPLFLGGKDEISNLEIGDMAVYLETCAQLWNQVKNLPAGTKISGIDISR